MHAHKWRDQGAGQTRQASTEAEGNKADKPGVNAERLCQLLVHDDRLGHDANLGSAHDQPHEHAQHDCNEEQDETIQRICDSADAHGLCDATFSELNLASEIERNALDNDDVETPSRENRVEGPDVKAPKPSPPGYGPDRGPARQSDHQRTPRSPVKPSGNDCRIAAKHEKSAVGEVDDLQDTVGDEEAE